MVANIVVILLLVLVVLIWSHFGLFSALLQLIATLVAGALALALWEPVVYGILMKINGMTEYAWGSALLGSFLLFLILLRLILDKVVRANVDFSSLTNNIGGGFVGLLVGILTLGLLGIGLGFLPLGVSILGYKPLVISRAGTVSEHNRLLVPVDRLAARFFGQLSSGTFYGGQSLAEYLPNLSRQAELFRLHPDDNASVAARPEMVQLGPYYRHPLPLKNVYSEIATVLQSQKAVPHELVMVETIVTESSDAYVHSPYDSDRRMRLAPTQVRLMTQSPRDRQRRTDLLAPTALVYEDSRGRRQFVACDSADVSAQSVAKKQIVGWVFLMPESDQARFLLFRRLRLPLPDPAQANTADRDVIKSLGEPRSRILARDEEAALAARAKKTGSTFEPGSGGPKSGAAADRIQISNELPRAINRNMSVKLEINNRQIVSGKESVRPGSGQTPKNLVVNRIAVINPGLACVRLRLKHETVYTFLGKIRQSAAQLGGVYLIDSFNGSHPPDGYVLLKRDGEQEIHIPKYQPIRSASQLPIDQMKKDDSLYLYFFVPKELSIASYKVGERDQPLSELLELK